MRERGEDPNELIDDYIAAINDAVRERPADMTICVHLCRGNQGHGQASGGYDPVAERLQALLGTVSLRSNLDFRIRSGDERGFVKMRTLLFEYKSR